MAARRWIVLGCAALSGCIAPKPIIVSAPKPVIVTQTDTILRVERVVEPLPAADFSCPADPVPPLFPTPKQLGQYLADIVQVADECRAKLDVLRKEQP